MEKIYFNIEEKIKKYSKVFWVLSFFSWVLFTVISFFSILNIYSEKAGILFTIVKYPLYTWYSKSKIYTGGTIYPLQMHPNFFYIIIAIISIVGGFSVFIYLALFINNKKIPMDDEILPSITKYSFIPLLLFSILFLIGEIYTYNVSRWERRNILGLIFDIIGLIAILFIYYKSNLTHNNNIKYIHIFQKFSYICIICLEWYYLCYIMTNICLLYLSNDYYFTIIKILGIILPIIFGLGVMIFAFFFKDLMAPLFSLLFFIGCILYFFKIDKIYRKQYNGVSFGVIYIVMIILLIALEIFISYDLSKAPKDLITEEINEIN